MNIFFGKISKKFDIKQIEEGYYQAPRDSGWFADLSLGDYVYLIGGDKIQFWQAKEWRVVDGFDRLYFDILNPNLGISVNQFAALNFLKVTKPLIVLTSRSARGRAFFKLELLHDIPIDELKDTKFYKSSSIYRNIKVLNNDVPDLASRDFQIFEKDGQLQIAPADFYAPIVFSAFRDNLTYVGQGSRHKDNMLLKISNAIAKGEEFTPLQLGLRGFYDAFFCDYIPSQKYFLVGAYWEGEESENRTDLFVQEGRWENGYDNKFLEEVKAVPVDSFIAIKSAYTRAKTNSVMKIKARGKVTQNPGDGRNLEVEWEQDFISFEVGFGGYLTTIKEVTKPDHIAAIWENVVDNQILSLGDGADAAYNEIIKLVEYKKQIIIQGPPGTGKTKLAKEIAAQMLRTEVSNLNKTEQFKFIQFHPSYSYEDFVRGIVAESNGDKIEYKNVNKNLCLFAEKAKQNLDDSKKDIINISKEKKTSEYFKNFVDDIKEKMAESELPIKLTDRVSLVDVDEDAFRYKGMDGGWTPLGNRMLFKDIIQAYVDGNKVRQDITKNKNLSGLAIQHATYFIRVLHMFQQYIALNQLNFDHLKPEKILVKNFLLIIDEINRANLSAVLGELIYALEYRGDEVESMYKVDGSNKLIIPENLFIIGTMNTADRSVGNIDYAIRRRFAFVNLPPKDLSTELGDDFHKVLFDKVASMFSHDTNLSKEFDGNDVQLGHSYFIDKSSEGGSMDIRLEYEIKPILLEYVNDGILIGENIKDTINKLEA